jgi:hypothetical protein
MKNVEDEKNDENEDEESFEDYLMSMRMII